MRKSILISCLFILTTFLNGQEIKISLAPTLNFAPYYKSVLGGPGQNVKAGFICSFDYLFNNDKRLKFGTGLNYNFNQLEFTQNLNTGEMVPYIEKVNIFSVRFKTVYNFKNDFYLNLDPSLDFHLFLNNVHILNSQTGIGFALGVGKNIKLNDALYLNIEPKLWIHNIIPFNYEPYPYHLTTIGLNVGLIFGHKVTTIQTDK